MVASTLVCIVLSIIAIDSCVHNGVSECVGGLVDG